MKTLDSKSKYLKFQPQEPRVFFQKDKNRWTSSATWHNKNLTSILSVSLKICDLCWPLLTFGSLKSVSVKNGDLECHDVLKRSKFLSREIFKLEKQICLDKKMSNFDSLQKTAKNRRRRRKVRGGAGARAPMKKSPLKIADIGVWCLHYARCPISLATCEKNAFRIQPLTKWFYSGFVGSWGAVEGTEANRQRKRSLYKRMKRRKKER